MYIVDFFKKVFKLKNIFVMVYLFINILVISFVLCLVSDSSFAGLILAKATLIYFASLCLALTPFGESVLRFTHHFQPINRYKYKDRFIPLFDEVYSEAKKHDKHLSNNIKFYFVEDESVNACALGLNTICINTGIEKLDNDEIKGVLAHEFGHISHHDSILTLAIVLGNIVILLAEFIIRLLISFIGFFIPVREVKYLFYRIFDFIIRCISYIWTMIGVFLVCMSSRDDEYKADRFATELGYGNGLCKMFSRKEFSRKMGLLDLLSSTHPASDKRIEKIKEYLQSGTNNRKQVAYSTNTKTCPRCKNVEINNDAMFCSNCGSALKTSQYVKERTVQPKQRNNTTNSKINIQKFIPLLVAAVFTVGIGTCVVMNKDTFFKKDNTSLESELEPIDLMSGYEDMNFRAVDIDVLQQEREDLYDVIYEEIRNDGIEPVVQDITLDEQTTATCYCYEDTWLLRVYYQEDPEVYDNSVYDILIDVEDPQDAKILYVKTTNNCGEPPYDHAYCINDYFTGNKLIYRNDDSSVVFSNDSYIYDTDLEVKNIEIEYRKYVKTFVKEYCK